MKTIHVKGLGLNDGMLNRWYKGFLKDDPKFHYVYWENGTTHKAFIGGKNILIRLSDETVIDKLKKYLDQKELSYEEYDYPHTRKKFQLGLKKKSWEDRHLDISLMMDHLCSVAALELNEKDWNLFFGQLLHIACNSKNISFSEQTILLMKMVYGSFIVANDQYKGIYKK